MAGLSNWALQVLIAVDQLCTALLGGFADETMSSYAWRMEQQGKPWGVMRRVIDAIFWWQPNHCREAYRSEVLRRQDPPELRS